MVAPLVMAGEAVWFVAEWTAPQWAPAVASYVGTAMVATLAGAELAEVTKPGPVAFAPPTRWRDTPVGICRPDSASGGPGDDPEDPIEVDLLRPVLFAEGLQRARDVQNRAEEICAAQDLDWEDCLDLAESEMPTTSYALPFAPSAPSDFSTPLATVSGGRAHVIATMLNDYRVSDDDRENVRKYLNKLPDADFKNVQFLFDRLPPKGQQQLLKFAAFCLNYDSRMRLYMLDFVVRHWDDYSPLDGGPGYQATVISNLWGVSGNRGIFNEMEVVDRLEGIAGVMAVCLNLPINEPGQITEMDAIVDVTDSSGAVHRVCVVMKQSPRHVTFKALYKQIFAARHLGYPLVIVFTQGSPDPNPLSYVNLLQIPSVFVNELQSMDADSFLNRVFSKQPQK